MRFTGAGRVFRYGRTGNVYIRFADVCKLRRFRQGRGVEEVQRQRREHSCSACRRQWPRKLPRPKRDASTVYDNARTRLTADEIVVGLAGVRIRTLDREKLPHTTRTVSTDLTVVRYSTVPPVHLNVIYTCMRMAQGSRFSTGSKTTLKSPLPRSSNAKFRIRRKCSKPTENIVSGKPSVPM